MPATVGPVQIGTDAASVRQQYGTEARLQTRASVWRGSAPQDHVLTSLEGMAPGRVVEVGCGTGALAALVQEALPGCEVLATDISPRMVELASARGVSAQVADSAALPFADGSADVVLACWMLYHVPDLAATLRELRRVLRPDGVLIAVTNGDRHLAELYELSGGTPPPLQFSSENGRATLEDHFEQVAQVDFATVADFPDAAAAREYLRTFAPELASALPEFNGPRSFAGAVTVFAAV